MNTQIITPGEKIKQFRKTYKIKQHEITNGDISRNMLSMIENNKAGLIESTAKIIINNINKICKNRSIDYTVDLETLMESGESQAHKICNEALFNLDNNPKIITETAFKDELNAVISIADKYNLKQYKANIYLKLGHYYRNIYDYQNAYTNYLISFENQTELFNNSDVIDLILKINFCCSKLNKYTELLQFNNLAKIYVANISKENKFKIEYGNAHSHKKLNDFHSALKVIDSIENEFESLLDSNILRKINISILKANCYAKLKSFNEALNLHKETLILTQGNLEMHLYVLINIISIYIDLNDRKNLKIYLDKAVFLLNDYVLENERIYSPQIYNTIGLGFSFLKDYDISKLHFNKALSEARKFNNNRILSISLENLFEIYSSTNDSSSLNDLKNLYLELLSSNMLEDNYLIFDFIKYYNDHGDSETIDDIIGFIKSKK